jgi:hypothetical protein
VRERDKHGGRTAKGVRKAGMGVMPEGLGAGRVRPASPSELHLREELRLRPLWHREEAATLMLTATSGMYCNFRGLAYRSMSGAVAVPLSPHTASVLGLGRIRSRQRDKHPRQREQEQYSGS